MFMVYIFSPGFSYYFGSYWIEVMLIDMLHPVFMKAVCYLWLISHAVEFQINAKCLNAILALLRFVKLVGSLKLNRIYYLVFSNTTDM